MQKNETKEQIERAHSKAQRRMSQLVSLKKKLGSERPWIFDQPIFLDKIPFNSAGGCVEVKDRSVYA